MLEQKFHTVSMDVCFVSSFPQFDVKYVTKLLALFEKEGLITRIAKGVYIKARKTRFGVVYPSAFELVKEIAKRDKAKIIPTGDTTANRLGFSTQVPMNACFLTSGSSRKLTLGKRTITLRHGSPKNFTYKGKLMPELVQARFQRFTSSLHQKTEMIIYIIRTYSYCHEQNHPRFRLTVKSSLVSSCEDVLHFLLSFGHLAKIRSVIWPNFIRSFGQVSFGRLAKIRSVVLPNQHVTSVVLPNPSLQIGFRCPYM